LLLLQQLLMPVVLVLAKLMFNCSTGLYPILATLLLFQFCSSPGGQFDENACCALINQYQFRVFC